MYRTVTEKTGEMTIFTALKPNEGRIAEIQARSQANWRECFPDCEIVDVGENRRFDQILARLRPGEVAAWINADILFVNSEDQRNGEGRGVAETLAACFAALKERKKGLVVGQRTDLLPGGQMELHRPSGMDYFFFTKETFEGLPPVVMGRSYCDSALVAHCLRKRIPVIDATKVITALHQWHDYAHVDGGREEVFSGEEALANKRENGLHDFGPHVADAGWRFEAVDEVERTGGGGQRTCRLSVVKRHVPVLRRLGLWGMWNRVTRGGIGSWGIHEYRGKNGCRFFTRSKVEVCSPNSNVQMRFKQVVDAPRGIWTGFDFPCLWRGWREKVKGDGERWTLFLWDPPALSHRDRFPLLRWAIDLVFRWFARRCDKLVLNIHPGLLDEIGFSCEEVDAWRKSGKLECRMQDAFDGLVPAPISAATHYDCDFGVLSNWAEEKGGPLMAEALRRLPGKTCLWIGNMPCGATRTSRTTSGSPSVPDVTRSIHFAGWLPQECALEKLKKCRLLVAPYLPVRSLKWNYVLKIFEYLQLGRPILASDNPGNAAVAAKYPGRITLFKGGDVDDLVRALRDRLNDD